MNVSCVGFYYIKDSSSNQKQEVKWIKANLEINALIDRYMLEIKPILVDDDIYDEDEDEKFQKLPRNIRLSDYKACVQRGTQKFNNFILRILVLNPKLFTKAKRVYLAFLTEDMRSYWHQNLDTIFTHKFQRANSVFMGLSSDTHSGSSLDQFMIDNDVYEGSLMPGEFTATVIDNDKSKEISIKGQYVLVVTDVGIELRDDVDKKIIKLWEIKNMRRFGEKENIFFLELGKYCSDGQGFLSFKVDKGKKLISELLQTKDLWLKNKSKPKNDVVKSSEDEIFSTSDKNDEIIVTRKESHSPKPVQCDNKLYDLAVDGDHSNSVQNQNTICGPPKVAPPPIPKEAKECESVD